VSALKRRLARLEDVLLPKPRPSVCMLSEPASNAPAETWAEYRRQVYEAKARGDFLILLVPMKPTDRPRTERGVTYCGSEFEAQLAAALMLPSRRGNESLLGDVMKSLSGNVIGPQVPGSSNKRLRSWLRTIYPCSLASLRIRRTHAGVLVDAG
jgi:hypothetical protein